MMSSGLWGSTMCAISCCALIVLGAGSTRAQEPLTESVLESIDVAPVWAGHRVGFCLLTRGDAQFVAFYDVERNMTVGKRKLSEKTWEFVRLPERVEWDSHNYVTMTVDDDGYLHLSGNMHCVPLVYFRTSKPLDISTFERVKSMTGSLEDRVTYPRFLRGASNELLFTYRHGGSGDGEQIYNIYDHNSRMWRRLLDKPFTWGEGQRNAYFAGPIKGSDGFFHLCWVWRDDPDCATNHDLCYARSKDLVKWETSTGKPLELPITLGTSEIVDPVPVKGGMINGNTRIGFDSKNRVIISYHKFDSAGKTQLYNARLENGKWKLYQTSEWDYRWDFGGKGSIVFEITIGAVQVGADGKLTQSFSHPKAGDGIWTLDEKTLQPVAVSKPAGLPEAVTRLESDFPGMKTAICIDSGDSGERGVRYIMKWETLGPYNDRPRESVPPPSMLRVYKLQ